jgi:hypothetical protein
MKCEERVVVEVFMEIDLLEWVKAEAHNLEICVNDLMILAIMKYIAKPSPKPRNKVLFG